MLQLYYIVLAYALRLQVYDKCFKNGLQLCYNPPIIIL